jgi:RNA polymerase sigma-70 factor (ECF subfamily)
VRDLLEQYVPRVFRFALRLTNDHHAAEDLTQESMLRAWKHHDRLRDPRRSLAWLFQIAANVWRDQRRRRRHLVSQASSLEGDLEANTVAADSLVADQDDLRRALQAMQSLPARQRQVLHLHACEGLTRDEIAEVLAISPAAVKASLSLARKRMRVLLACGEAPCGPFAKDQPLRSDCQDPSQGFMTRHKGGGYQ